MKRLAAAFAMIPSAALACALPPSVILTLPTRGYIAGAGATVALTALLGVMSGRFPRFAGLPLWKGADLWPRKLTPSLIHI